MGDLNSEVIELEWINLFYAAIQGKPSVNDEIDCFRKYNYTPFPFNKFNITVEEEGLEIQKEVTPDFILWNREIEAVLIIEIKGENSVERSHLEQLNKYKEISIDEIQTRLRNATDDRTIIIKASYTGIVYRKETIESCEKSENCIELLDIMKKDHLVFTQNHAERLILLNPNLIDFDEALKNGLSDGFPLPLNPMTLFYLTKSPCKKGVIWAIINYIYDRFYSGEPIDEIRITPLNLRRDVFFYSDAKLNKIIEALENLFRMNICSRIEREYIFNYNNLQDLDTILERIENIDCEQQAPIQQDLFRFFRQT
ncbi:MAG: hypothetical protein BAJALOKI1v1_590022 [Promethearchaeota archaeon]|nr:MAG: hypothetical protein BAJALOKI1v1_590022 [Candidatus Lokiarchaeota archaeon]